MASSASIGALRYQRPIEMAMQLPYIFTFFNQPIPSELLEWTSLKLILAA